MRWVPRAGQAHILDKTYANCVDQTSSRMFYGIAAAENLMVWGGHLERIRGSTTTKTGLLHLPRSCLP